MAAVTTMERLFMQIFDRKACIESQMRQQIESYAESVSCNLLADGLAPPHWLWDHGSDARGGPGHRDLSRHEIIQGVLLPLPLVSTPFTDLSTIYSLPAVKSNILSNCTSFANETCISNKHILPEQIVAVKTMDHNKDDQAYRDLSCSVIVETSLGCDSLSNILRKPEDCMNEKSHSANFGDEGAVERDGDGAAAFRSFDCPDNLSKPSVSSGFISNNTNQASFMLNVQHKLDNLALNNSHDASVKQCCIATVEKEFILNEFNVADSRLKTTMSSLSKLSQDCSVAVIKKLIFDGIEIYCLDDYTSDSFSEEQNHCCPSEGKLEKVRPEQSLKRDPASNLVHAFGAVELEEDSLNAEAVQSAGASAHHPYLKERKESEYHSPSTSNSKPCRKLPLLSEESHSGLNNSMNNSSSKFSDIQVSQSNTYGGSPPQCPIDQSKEQHHSEPSTRQISTTLTPQLHAVSSCVPMHSPDKIKTYGVNKDHATSLEEAMSNYAEISSAKLFDPIKDQELQRNSKSLSDLSDREQFLQELPTMEVVMEEAKMPTGKDNVEGHDESIYVAEICKYRTCRTSLDPERGLWRMVSSIDSHKNQLYRNLMDQRMENIHTGNVVETSFYELDFSRCDIQSDTSVLQTDEVYRETESTEFVTEEIGSGTVSKFTSILHNAGYDSAGNSASVRDVSGFHGSSLSSLDNQHLAFLTGENPIEPTVKNVPVDVAHCEKHACIPVSNKIMSPELQKDETCEIVMDSMEKGRVRIQDHSSDPRYFLRNLNRHREIYAYSHLNQTGTSSKRLRVTMTNPCEMPWSWPKRRRLNCYSDGILGTTTRIRRHQLLHTQEDSSYSSKKSSESASLVEMQITSSSSKSMLNIDEANADLRRHSGDCHRSQKQCVKEDDKFTNQDIDVSIPTQCTDLLPSPSLATKNSMASLVNGICCSGSTLLDLEEPGSSGGESDYRLNCLETIDHCSSLQSKVVRQISDSEKDVNTNDSSVLSSLKDDLMDNGEFVPEFEGFNIGVSPSAENDNYSNSDFQPFRDCQSLNVLRDALTGLATPKVLSSGNCKINTLPDAFESLPNGFMKHINLIDSLCFHNGYVRQPRTSKDDKVPIHDSSLGSTFEISFLEMPNSHSTSSSGARIGRVASKPPLTPPIQKSSSRKVSMKSGTLGSNPELVCFRIDENSSTAEDDDPSDELGNFEEVTYSKGIKVLDNRELLKDISSTYENTELGYPFTKEILERGILEFSNSKSLPGTRSNVDSSLGSPYTNKTDKIADKENQRFSVNEIQVMKMVKSSSCRPSEPDIIVKSQANSQKVYTQSNIISNVSSFVPMVKNKQEAKTSKGKKDIKVKSLEAAVAAKRLEEKKQIEREMRKAAAKLEREIRLEKEKQLKLKQFEEKRKKEADITARKRQREEEKKEKGRKRRCIEEAGKLQREPEERLPRKKEDQLQCKATVDDGRKKGVVEAVKQQLKSEREGAGAATTVVVESAAMKVATSLNAMHGTIHDKMSTSKQNEDLQSYEISPYKDSDDEDVEMESLGRGKFVPSWAGRQCLDQTLLLQCDLDPMEIFAGKCSFNLNEVLQPLARQPL